MPTPLNTSAGDQTPQSPLWRSILPDLLALVTGLLTAYLLKWETRDLVWSLWLGSLVLGYLTILAVLGSAVYIGLNVVRNKDFPRKFFVPAILIGSLAGLFFLAFFSLHFCGFHAGHSVFLMQFFPIEGMPQDGFGRAFMNPPLLWVMVFRYLMQAYGIFLIPAIIAERKHVFQSLIIIAQAIKKETSPDGAGPPTPPNRNIVGNVLTRPYINVMRMHLLIFVFAFFFFMKIDSFAVYAAVYIVYFFPWGEIRKRMRGPNAQQVFQ